MTGQWLTTTQVAELSGRHRDNVLRALRRGLLVGAQPRVRCEWRVSEKAFDEWMAAGAPVDAPAKARLRRAS